MNYALVKEGRLKKALAVVCIPDIPLSVGVVEPRAPPQLNTIEFLWSPEKSASVFIQVCLSVCLCVFICLCV